mgnify:CR=1 FL=1
MIGKRFSIPLPGLSSYSGRYAYFAAIVGLVLLAAGYLGWNHVTRTGEKQISQLENRAMTAGVLADAQSHLNLLENHLQRLIIQPEPDDLDALERRNRRLISTLQQLKTSLQRQNSANVHLAMQLGRDAEKLARATHDLIDVRTHVERWFPALRLMRDEMLPRDRNLLSLLDELLVESEQGSSPEARLKVYKLTTSLRRDWLNMISEMRMFVASRFGIFSSEVGAGMRQRLLEVHRHAEQIPTYLQQLQAMVEAGHLDPTAESALAGIATEYAAWMQAFEQLSRVLENPDWRMDLLLMNDAVAPIIEHMRQRLTALDTELDAQSAWDITQLTRITRQLSKSILGLAIAGILLILFAYLFLRRNLLRPIAETALALKQEAQGLVNIAPPPASLQETRDLVDAFTEMRKQVHTRQRSLDHMVHHMP